jgi:hypothetical protein
MSFDPQIDSALTVQEMDTDFPSARETAFHCAYEWHLARLRPACLPIYVLACRITGKQRPANGKIPENPFFPSAESIGHYLGLNERTVRRGLTDLTEAGFLKLKSSRPFCTNTYVVVSHTEWAEQNPGQCAEKVRFPWEGEGSPLGRRLYALSSGRIKPTENVMVGIRRACPDNERLLEHFSQFLKIPPKREDRAWKMGIKFLMYLKEIPPSPGGRRQGLPAPPLKSHLARVT